MFLGVKVCSNVLGRRLTETMSSSDKSCKECRANGVGAADTVLAFPMPGGNLSLDECRYRPWHRHTRLVIRAWIKLLCGTCLQQHARPAHVSQHRGGIVTTQLEPFAMSKEDLVAINPHWLSIGEFTVSRKNSFLPIAALWATHAPWMLPP